MPSHRSVRSSAFKMMTLFCCLTLYSFFPVRDVEAADPRTAQAAEQLLEISGADRMLDVIWPALAPMMKSSFNAQYPRKEKEVDAIMGVFSQEFKASKKEFIQRFSEKYAENFSYDELMSVIEFYKTPTGKKLLEKQPTIMAESSQIGSEIAQKIIARMAKNNPKLFEALMP